MAIKAVVFDLAGVLLLTVKGTFNSLLAERLNVPLEDVERVMNDPMNDRWDLAEIDDDEFFTFLLAELYQPLQKKSILASFVVDDFYIDPLMLNFVHDLHRKYHTALLTNFPAHLHESLRTKWIVDGAFDHIIASCDVKLLKPDPRIYKQTLAILGCRPEEVIFIDDREINIKAAESLGIRCVLYEDREQGIKEIKSLLSIT